jgi:hypothetical protein
VAAAADAASCCGPVATVVTRGGSPIAAALPSARGALDDRRLVGTDASDLSALAGARAGTTGVTLRTRKRKNEHRPLEIKVAQGKYHLPQTGEAPLPLLQGFSRHHCDARRRCRSTRQCPSSLPQHSSPPAARAGACSTDCSAAGASVPAAGACSTTTFAALGDGGGKFHLSVGGGTPPVALFFLLLRRVLRHRRGEPLLLTQPLFLTLLLPALPTLDSPLLPARRPLLLPSLRGAGGRPGPGRWWI